MAEIQQEAARAAVRRKRSIAQEQGRVPQSFQRPCYGHAYVPGRQENPATDFWGQIQPDDG